MVDIVRLDNPFTFESAPDYLLQHDTKNQIKGNAIGILFTVSVGDNTFISEDRLLNECEIGFTVLSNIHSTSDVPLEAEVLFSFLPFFFFPFFFSFFLFFSFSFSLSLKITSYSSVLWKISKRALSLAIKKRSLMFQHFSTKLNKSSPFLPVQEFWSRIVCMKVKVFLLMSW